MSKKLGEIKRNHQLEIRGTLPYYEVNPRLHTSCNGSTFLKLISEGNGGLAVTAATDNVAGLAFPSK